MIKRTTLSNSFEIEPLDMGLHPIKSNGKDALELKKVFTLDTPKNKDQLKIIVEGVLEDTEIIIPVRLRINDKLKFTLKLKELKILEK